jgi:hypothetical protein
VNIIFYISIMTLQQTVNVTQERRVFLDLPVPEDIPVGKIEVKIIFLSPKSALTTKKTNTQSLCGMFADTGDTLDKFLIRKHAEKQFEYENE